VIFQTLLQTRFSCLRKVQLSAIYTIACLTLSSKVHFQT